MKKILFSIAMIALVSVAVVGATRAYFSDTETVTGNTFAAGSLDLEVGDEVAMPFNVSGILPGDSGEGQVTITSVTGSIDAELDVNITNIVQNENGCLAPEVDAGDPCGGGDLGLGLQMAMFLDVNQDGSYNQADGDIELEYSGNTNTTAGLQFSNIPNFEDKKWDDVMTLSADDEVDLVIQWQLPSTWTYPKSQAILMSDTLTFDVEASLEQVGGDGGVSN